MDDVISWSNIFSWENVAVTIVLAVVIYGLILVADKLLSGRGEKRDHMISAYFSDDKAISAFVDSAANASSKKEVQKNLVPIAHIPVEYDNAGDMKAVTSTERKVLKAALAKLRVESDKSVAATESHPEVVVAAREQDENAAIIAGGSVQGAIFAAVDSVRELREQKKTSV